MWNVWLHCFIWIIFFLEHFWVSWVWNILRKFICLWFFHQMPVWQTHSTLLKWITIILNKWYLVLIINCSRKYANYCIMFIKHFVVLHIFHVLINLKPVTTFTIWYDTICNIYSALRGWYSQLNLLHCTINRKNNVKKPKTKNNRKSSEVIEAVEIVEAVLRDEKESTVRIICGAEVLVCGYPVYNFSSFCLLFVYMMSFFSYLSQSISHTLFRICYITTYCY